MIRRLFFDDSHLNSVTVIIQNDNNILYSAPNLHSTPHASLELDTLSSLSRFYQSKSIRLSVIANENADCSGLANCNGIYVAFPHHNQLSSLSSRINGGLKQFDTDLASYMLTKSSHKDSNRDNGLIRQNHPSFVTSIKLGFGRVQKKSNKKTWYYREVKQPTLDTYPF